MFVSSYYNVWMGEGYSGELGEIFGRLGASGVLGEFGELVRPLEEYDRDHNSDLVRTLRVFFETNSNASEAAGRLYLHRNSMNYRLERVQRITGLDIGNHEVRLALQLGLLANGYHERRGDKDETQHT